jgi:HD-like signal output (HDOD) protein
MNGSELMRKILEGGSLPGMLPVALRLLEMSEDEAADAREMARVIEGDPGLSLSLLRLVNSPAYRQGPAEVTSVQRALGILGLREVCFMALSMSLTDALLKLPGGADYHLFWRASIHRAMLVRLLGEKVRLPNPAEAGTLALTLEIGLPMLLKALEPDQLAGFPGFHVSLDEQLAWERDRFGLDHRQAGLELVNSWKLPEVFAQCQAYHGQQTGPPPSPLVELVNLCRLAVESFFAPGVELTAIQDAARASLGLEPEELNQMLVASLTSAGDLATAMEIKLDRQADLTAVLEKAHAKLGDLRAQAAPRLRAILGEEPDLRQVRKKALLAEISSVIGGLKGLAEQFSVHAMADDLAARQAQTIVEEADRLEQVLDEIDGFTEF